MMRRYSDLFLSFDDHGADVARTMGYRAAETLLLTADDELYCPSPETIVRDIDVSFIGSLGDPVAHKSRRRMVDIVRREAKSRGWNVALGTAWVEGTAGRPENVLQEINNVEWAGNTHTHTPYKDIVDIYRRSKIVLNHATDVGQPFGMGYGLQCRHFEVGMTRTCLLSNATYDGRWSVPRFSSEETLLSNIEGLLGINPQLYDEGYGKPLWECYANDLYTWSMQNKPEHRAAQLIDFIEKHG